MKGSGLMLKIEDILEEVKNECKSYGYDAFLRFNEIHIRTKFESWYFEFNEDGMIKLMHGNYYGKECMKWHKQFSRKITIPQLFIYIHEHETAKFSDTFVDFTFTKNGACKVQCI